MAPIPMKQDTRQPATAAGRAMMAEGEDRFFDWTAMAGDVRRHILAIEAEAADAPLREALERLGERHHSLSDEPPHMGTVFRMRPAFEGLQECPDYVCAEARAALTTEPVAGPDAGEPEPLGFHYPGESAEASDDPTA